MIATAAVGMPRGGLETISIVFSEIKLGTTRSSAAASRIAISMTVPRICEVEIIVHISMCIGQIHVELHEAASQIERGFGTDSGATMDRPTIGAELWTAIINVEVVSARTIRRVPTR